MDQDESPLQESKTCWELRGVEKSCSGLGPLYRGKGLVLASLEVVFNSRGKVSGFGRYVCPYERSCF